MMSPTINPKTPIDNMHKPFLDIQNSFISISLYNIDTIPKPGKIKYELQGVQKTKINVIKNRISSTVASEKEVLKFRSLIAWYSSSKNWKDNNNKITVQAQPKQREKVVSSNTFYTHVFYVQMKLMHLA